MTAATFLAAALSFTLAEEGGYVDDPRDPGGATEDGITLAAWRAFSGELGATAAQLQAIGTVQRTAFYAAQWNAVHGDALPLGVDLNTFDAWVNTRTNAARQLQRVAGLTGASCDGWIGPETLAAVARIDAGGLALRLQRGAGGGVAALQGGLGLRQDGVMGPITLTAAKAHRDAVIVAALFDQQATFYRACDNFPTYGRGWLARAGRRAAAAMALALPGPGLQAPIS